MHLHNIFRRCPGRPNSRDHGARRWRGGSPGPGRFSRTPSPRPFTEKGDPGPADPSTSASRFNPRDGPTLEKLREDNPQVIPHSITPRSVSSEVSEYRRAKSEIFAALAKHTPKGPTSNHERLMTQLFNVSRLRSPPETERGKWTAPHQWATRHCHHPLEPDTETHPHLSYKQRIR